MQKPSTAQISWEYLMPKPREIAARYIRESDPTMGESSTMESQAKYVSQHCQKEGYLMPPEFEFREAISGYNVSYMQRPELLRLLEAVKKGLVNVVVISEVRALSRKQVEIFVIYDLLQKYHCRLETVLEKFEDSTMGRLILSLRAAFSEIERDQIYLRLERGKKHRREDGAPNGHPKPAYGYRFYNTKHEVKAGYEFNDIIIHVDADGGEWSEHAVCLFIFALLLRRYSLKKITNKLNDLGIPPPRKATKREPHWSSSTLFRMFSNKIYIGEVWNNRFAKVDGRMVRRPESEWELVCRAPAMIDRETFDIIQRQFAFNKEEALRNNKHTDDLGLLRSGYIYCGVCGCRMSVIYPTPSMIRNHNGPFYRCYQREGGNHSLNHTTTIGLKLIDSAAWEKVLEVLLIFAFSHLFWLSLLALLLFGIAQNGVGATVITLAQLRVAPQMRGRVMSLNTLLIMGVRPLGDFPASGLIALVGGPLTVIICALIVGAYSLYLLIGKPVIRSL